MKILIMVLSYCEEPYLSLMRVQQVTWGAYTGDKDIQIVYYYGSHVGYGVQQNDQHAYSCELGFNITDAYYCMAGKFKLALEWVFYEEAINDFDYIYRTNSSSYINIEKLKLFAEKHSSEDYVGWTMEDSNFDGGAMVSGAGMLLSRKAAEVLKDNIPMNEEREEDVLIGRVLRAAGLTATDDRTRIDWPQESEKDIHEAYHIRFKTGDRLQDAENMRELHNILKQKDATARK